MSEVQLLKSQKTLQDLPHALSPEQVVRDVEGPQGGQASHRGGQGHELVVGEGQSGQSLQGPYPLRKLSEAVAGEVELQQVGGEPVYAGESVPTQVQPLEEDQLRQRREAGQSVLAGSGRGPVASAYLARGESLESAETVHRVGRPDLQLAAGQVEGAAPGPATLLHPRLQHAGGRGRGIGGLRAKSDMIKIKR